MEKFMKKMWKKSEGFTLVELIVVIAILGILAAVAVPAYSGYIKKASESADLQTLASVATAVSGAVVAEGATVDKIEIPRTKDGTTFTTDTMTVTTDPADKYTDTVKDQVEALLGQSVDSLSFKAEWIKATMEDGEWTFSY